MDVQQTSAVSISAPQAAAIRLRARRRGGGARDRGRRARRARAAVARGRGRARAAAARPARGRQAAPARRRPRRRPARAAPRGRGAIRPPRGMPASVVAELAESGDGDQLRAALALAGGPIPLPGGRVLTVEPDARRGVRRPRAAADEGRCASSCTRRRSARSSCGSRCTAARLDVNVVADAAVAPAAAAALPELRERRARLDRPGAAGRGGRAPRRAAAGAGRSLPVGEVRALCLSREEKVAAALSYPGHGAPKVVAAGKGLVAERILELAREAGVPTREDSALAQALAELELGTRDPAAALPGGRGGARLGAPARPQPPSLTRRLNWLRGTAEYAVRFVPATPASRRRRSAPEVPQCPSNRATRTPRCSCTTTR